MQAYRDNETSIGAELELDDFAALANDPSALRELQATLDRRAVVRIASAAPIRAESIERLTRQLGEPAVRGAPSALPDYDFIQDFSSIAKHDDGRQRTPGFIESLHYDVFANGPAAYAVQVLHLAPPTVPMRFVDMRAVYTSLPDAIKTRLTHVRALHASRPPLDGSRAPVSRHPVAAKHPRTVTPILLLSNKRDSKLEGLPEDEGRALHAELWRIVETFGVRYESVMASNEIYVWDNIACVHDNPAFPRSQERRSWFFNILREGEIEALAAQDSARLNAQA